MLQDIALIAVAILLPIVPAFILYKLLPSTSTVSGPFKGLTIQLQGAFGGYFLLVLIVFGFYYFILPKSAPDNSWDVYTVSGSLGLGEDRNTQAFLISLAPPIQSITPDGKFSVEIPVRPAQAGGVDFPSLIIEHPSYMTQTLHLGEGTLPDMKSAIVRDTVAKTVTVQGVIPLQSKTAAPKYAPNTVLTPETTSTGGTNP